MSTGWAIVGIGRHADRYMAPAIARAKDCHLRGVLSREKTRAAAFATKHAAQRSYDSYDELLQDPEVDAVYIATPNSLHAPQTIQAAEAGKHVLCEKPMALTIADCEAMIEACQKRGVKLGVGFHLRHQPAHIQAQRLIASGEVGEVIFARAQYAGLYPGPRPAWRLDPQMVGGGSMMGTGVHAIDLLRFLLGQEVREVSAFTDGLTPGHPLDDIALGMLRFEREALGLILCSSKLPYTKNDLEVYGSRARIVGIGTLGGAATGKLTLTGQGVSAEWQFEECAPYVAEIEAFSRCIEEDTEPNASGIDGLRVAEVTIAVFESQRQGKTIRLR